MFFVDIDIEDLRKFGFQLSNTIRIAMDEAARHLTTATHRHIVEKANAELRSSRQKFLDCLHIVEEGNDTWLIVVDQEAMWIEEGIEPGWEMIDDLLNAKPGKKPAKTARDGSRYRTIPFDHSKGPATNTPYQQELQNAIRGELQRAHNVLTGRAGIPYKKIETGAGGAPLLGKLHSLDIKTPLKTGHGPGQGWGRIGQPRVGATGIPFLKGLSVYQREMKDKDGNTLKDRHGKTRIARAFMTFRIVSTKHKGTGRWTHPGVRPHKFLDEAAIWAMQKWETEIAPKVIDYIVNNA
jgi:hypothetical protein